MPAVVHIYSFQLFALNFILSYMSTVFALIYLFFQKYLIPLLFVIGLLYFLYGFIEYFIVGKGGDEGRSQHGRELFLKSIAWFTISLIAFSIVALIGWISTFSFKPNLNPTSPPSGETNTNQQKSVLPVPNVPTR